jgi:carboxyl-terminal processing protease
MPDYFVPIDTSGVSDYLIQVRNRGLIYRFSLEYTDNNRKELQEISNLESFYSFLNSNGTLKEFIKFADKNDVPANNKEIDVCREILKTQLYAYIIRNILDNEGFYPAIESIDNTLLEAIDLLTTEDMYASKKL